MTLSLEDNAKLLQQLKVDFNRTINWNKYQSESILQVRNWYLNYLIDPSFWGVNRLFVLSFENDAYWRSYKRYFLSNVELEDYNNMIDQTVKKYYMKKFERLKLVKEIITQLVVCCITIIPKLL